MYLIMRYMQVTTRSQI